MKRLSPSLLSLLLAACASQAPAPVVDRSSSPVAKPAPVASTSAPSAVATPVPVATPVVVAATNALQPGAPGTYTVKKGETLYRIALDHGVYYRDLATWNELSDPNSIKEGQVLRVVAPTATAGGAVAVTQPVNGGAPVASKTDDGVKREPRVNKEAYSDAAWEKLQKSGETPAKPENAQKTESKPETKAVEAKPAESAAVAWAWPVGGKLMASFGEAGNKGIDVAGKDGDAIKAAADGKVFFVGFQKGYGNLLIIGHSVANANDYISVYAHNRKVLVKEKDVVTKGQKVAEMGKTESENGVKLHFEIRQQGKPVDPLSYLPKR